MAEIVPAIIAHCANNTAVTAAFGNRIRGDRLMDKPGGGAQTYPYAILTDITTGNLYTHQGGAGRVVMVQVDVYDDSPTDADTNAELIRSLFDAHKGMIGTINAGMVKARRVSGKWDEGLRSSRRILEIEVKTND
jgi:hypothetical protein